MQKIQLFLLTENPMLMTLLQEGFFFSVFKKLVKCIDNKMSLHPYLCLRKPFNRLETKYYSKVLVSKQKLMSLTFPIEIDNECVCV